MKKFAFNLTLLLMLSMSFISISACSDDNEGTTSVTETVDYYGTQVPYMPMEEKDYPEWLRVMKKELGMMGLYRICVGTLNNETVYHLNLWPDSSLSGRVYDKDGKIINYKGDLPQILNVKCIYYYKVSK